jgi:hypothetical protein
MEKYSKKENQEFIGTSPQPTIVAERETGLTPEEKQTVKRIMLRNDKVLRMLAEM